MKTTDPEEWLIQFNAVENLRILNKYHSHDLIENLELFITFCKDSVENLRSNISKNALMFCTELFNNKEIISEIKYCEQSTKFIKTIMPSLLFKTVYDKVFISKEAKTAVGHVIKNCIFLQTLESLLNEGCLCKSNNKNLIEQSHTTHLLSFIEILDPSNTHH